MLPVAKPVPDLRVDCACCGFEGWHCLCQTKGFVRKSPFLDRIDLSAEQIPGVERRSSCLRDSHFGIGAQTHIAALARKRRNEPEDPFAMSPGTRRKEIQAPNRAIRNGFVPSLYVPCSGVV
ncbi:MAG: hypothetical protein MnENMB40S_37470 [Rhizobiaceae bacterium MnEN-MB40S]|nr:MAG: hypothetical protein MnENMB40S_37470 [Rhizobiaceae bacterium MnEN-MB40S]